MGNTKKSVREIIAQCLWDAFEVLKEQSEIEGRNLVSVPTVTNLANEDERLQAYQDKIGDKSLYTKAEDSAYPAILKAIQTWKNDYKVTLKKANNTCKERLEKLDKKLESVEGIVIELQEKIHDLKKRLENREHQIELIEKDRDRYVHDLNALRKKNGYA